MFLTFVSSQTNLYKLEQHEYLYSFIGEKSLKNTATLTKIVVTISNFMKDFLPLELLNSVFMPPELFKTVF